MRLAVFCAVYYGPYFLKSSIASRAAKNDLQLIYDLRSLRQYEPEIARQSLLVMDRHTNYLGPSNVPFCLAEDELEEEQKREVADALLALLPSWDGGDFPAGEVQRPGPNFASGEAFWTNGKLKLSSFITLSSFLPWKMINQVPQDISTWIDKPVSEWRTYPAFHQFWFYIHKKCVTND